MQLEVICPEHNRVCYYNALFDKYTCIYSPTGGVAAMCGWSCSGQEAHKFVRDNSSSSETVHDSSQPTD